MSGGSKIRAVGPEQPLAEHEQPAAPGPSGEDGGLTLHQEWDDTPDPVARGWRLPLVAAVAVAGWTVFFLWAVQGDLAGGIAPRQAIALVVQWAVPTLLVVCCWILLTHNSRREAARFGEVARSLRGESEALEQRLAAVNRELSLAREFLAAQSRDLESLGRVAGERLSAHAEHLQSLVRANGDEVQAIATVSTTALENMGRLRDDLPVIANSARDVANHIGAAGRTAHGQIGELVAGFERLNQFGQASERQVGALQSRVDAALAAFEAQLLEMGDLTSARFEALRSASEDFRAELARREVDALAGLRRRAEALAEELAAARSTLDDGEAEAVRTLHDRIATIRDEANGLSSALRESEQQAADLWTGQVEQLRQRLLSAIDEVKAVDEAALESANRKLAALRAEAEKVDADVAARDEQFLSAMASRQAAMAEAEGEALAGLEQCLAGLDRQLADRRAALAGELEALASAGDAVAGKLGQVRDDVAAIRQAGDDVDNRLAAALAALESRLADGQAALADTQEAVAELTEASVRLLELIQATAQHTRTQIPAALDSAEGRLAALGGQSDRVRDVLHEAAAKSADLSAYVLASREESAAAVAGLDALQDNLGRKVESSLAHVASLSAALTGANEQSEALAARATGALSEAIALLEQNSRAAMGSVEQASADAVRALAERVANQSGKAIEKALAESAEGALVGLGAAAERAASAGREATIQLRDQLARVNELAGNLETRVARARELAEQEVDRDFARRVALISEGLNSTAIDLAKVLATDVSDTAWTAYLRGDRGIFTRRAVRLLDNTEAREVAELYDADPDFRENVSRYIADFENMLRTLLSTRDGKPVSVTLLSSDMGKLYVALAQAIERLRT